MRRLTLLLLLLLAFTATVAQQTIKMTQVTAVVEDASSNLYANCRWSVVLSPGRGGAPTPASVLGGQQGNCDASGNLSVSLADNLLTISPGGSQWSFSICSTSIPNTTGYYVGAPFCKSNMAVTVTGTTMNLTSTFQPLLPVLPVIGGGGLPGSGTNPFTATSTVTLPPGTGAAALALAIGAINYGFYNPTSNTGVGVAAASSNIGLFAASAPANTFQLTNAATLSWAPNAAFNSNSDTALSRASAAVVQVGNGTLNNTSGKLQAAGYMSVGTTFTSSGGLGDITLVGGATAGKFTTVTVTSGSTVITMGNTATAPTGWACSGFDIPPPADTVLVAPTSATTVTITVTAITAGDV